MKGQGKISSVVTENIARHKEETDASSVARLNQDATFMSLDDFSMSLSSDIITSFHFVTSYARLLRQITGLCGNNKRLRLT